jgi:NitT/TauT family transport system substrate-binding protein
VADKPLTIGYSDWPGWLVWEIAKQKGFFKEAGVKVELVWFEDYGKSIDAYGAGKLDGICIVCGDALTAKTQSVAIVLTDYSNGNDKIIAKKGIESFKDLKGKKIGVEENLVEHILLAQALKDNDMTEADIKLVKVSTETTPQALASGDVDAIGAWYPISGQALAKVEGSKAVYTSAKAPGLIYDAVQVSRESLAARRDDWKKVVGVWFKSLEFLEGKDTRAEAIKIMAGRISAKPEDLAKNLEGTFLLGKEGNLKALAERETLDSVYGSIRNANKFYLKHKVYTDSQDASKFVDPTLVKEVLGK